MSMDAEFITNQVVLDALNQGIKKRWPMIILNLQRGEWWSTNVDSCELCDVFDGCVDYSEGYGGYKPEPECQGCPLYLINGGLGCGKGSSFDEFHKYRDVKAAKRVLKDLKKAKKHFFGDQ